MKTYRICATYRQWIGKADASNFGKFEVYSNDPSWIHEKAARLKANGHRVNAIQRFTGQKWVTI